MSDIEMLELAAQASGVGWKWFGATFCVDKDRAMATYQPWNPLTDDGDALRLAVKIGLQVTCSDGGPEGFSYACTSDTAILYESHDADPYAATRRAIVRAAAEIAKATGAHP